MRRTSGLGTIIFFLLCLAGPGSAQVTWQTTHSKLNGYSNGACSLARGSLKAKVYPAYLEMEEDVEIAAGGQVDTNSDPNTLEITGTFSLPEGSAITGALLWDGDNVLAGNLQDRAKADSIYEDLVKRHSAPPPRPRDPLLLELIGADTYQFKIYPVKSGHSRHMRLRYQLAPRLGAAGLEMDLRAAVVPLFGGGAQVPVSFESGGGTDRMVLSQGGVKTELQLPRTRFLQASQLSRPVPEWNPEGYYYYPENTMILPVDPRRQVVVKTAFADGPMAGNYINLYAGVTDDLINSLVKHVEVVVLWKWHNPGSWLRQDQWGDIPAYISEAEAQGQELLGLYQMLGGPGNKVGLVHDDSRNAPHAFPVASRGEAGYEKAVDYLGSLQGGYVESFVKGIRALPAGKPTTELAGIKGSKDRFLANLRLVKSLFTPSTGTIRHILMVSTGPEFYTEATELNGVFDSLFQDAPASVSGLRDGSAYSQVGFDYWAAKRGHAYKGPLGDNPWADLPGFQALNLNVTVRNARKAYDFGVKCQGGVSLSCGNLIFHGKSDSPWADSLEWQAFDSDGKPIGDAKSLPSKYENPGDTAIAILWAGSGSPFSEKKEPAAGPVYGFVDRWASMLAGPKDSLKNAAAYADSGVPRLDNRAVLAELPNYEGGSNPNPNPGCVDCETSVRASKAAGIGDPSKWRIERSHGGIVLLRIPGLGAGVIAEIEVYDLGGKRAGYWTASSEEGFFRLDVGALRSGAYLLKIKAGGLQGVKRVML